MKVAEIMSAAANMGKLSGSHQPSNNVSLFISESFDQLFGQPKNETVILKNILIIQANADPQQALDKILKFKLLIEIWLENQKKG